MSSASLSVHIYTYIAILAHPSIDVCVVWLLCINTYILTFGPATLSLSDRGGGKWLVLTVSVSTECLGECVKKREKEEGRKKQTPGKSRESKRSGETKRDHQGLGFSFNLKNR